MTMTDTWLLWDFFVDVGAVEWPLSLTPEMSTN